MPDSPDSEPLPGLDDDSAPEEIRAAAERAARRDAGDVRNSPDREADFREIEELTGALGEPASRDGITWHPSEPVQGREIDADDSAESMDIFRETGDSTGIVALRTDLGSYPTPRHRRRPWTVPAAAAGVAAVVAGALVLSGGGGGGTSEAPAIETIDVSSSARSLPAAGPGTVNSEAGDGADPNSGATGSAAAPALTAPNLSPRLAAPSIGGAPASPDARVEAAFPPGDYQVTFVATRTNACASAPATFTKAILIVAEGAPPGGGTAGIAFWDGRSASRGSIDVRTGEFEVASGYHGVLTPGFVQPISRTIEIQGCMTEYAIVVTAN